MMITGRSLQKMLIRHRQQNRSFRPPHCKILGALRCEMMYDSSDWPLTAYDKVLLQRLAHSEKGYLVNVDQAECMLDFEL